MCNEHKNYFTGLAGTREKKIIFIMQNFDGFELHIGIENVRSMQITRKNCTKRKKKLFFSTKGAVQIAIELQN